jgi:molybdopterin synthase sulfur carrier subunit
MVRILYFAALRDRLRTESEELPLPAGVHDVGGLIASLRARGEPWERTLADEAHVLAAVNCTLAARTTTVRDGDEVALFPPITGGQA